MTRPTAKQIKIVSEVTGIVLTDEIATRVAGSIGPAFDYFSTIAGTLPLDLEPATFLSVQNAKADR